MTELVDPYQSPKAEDGAATAGAIPVPVKGYRPWSRSRTYMVFILGMHAAGFMMFFFHPVFPIFGLAFGIPAAILAGREIREIPESADHPFVRWGKLGGKIGVIGGPVAIAVWIIVGVIIAAAS